MRQAHDFVIASRFARLADGQWHDLVTGVPVDLVIEDRPASATEPVDQDGAEESPWLDWGSLDETRCFFARPQAPWLAPGRPTGEECRRIEHVVAFIDAPVQVGVRVVRSDGALSPAALSWLARRMRERGFALLAAWPLLSPRFFTHFGCRHVALVLESDKDRGAALQWLRRLGRASYRAHVLLDARSMALGRHEADAQAAPADVAREEAPPYAALPLRRETALRRRAERLARQNRPGAAAGWARAAPRDELASHAHGVAKLAADGRFARAEHELALLTAEAAIARRGRADSLLTATAALAFWRDQHERAAEAADAASRPGGYLRMLVGLARRQAGVDESPEVMEALAQDVLRAPSEWAWPSARELALLVLAEADILRGGRKSALRTVERSTRGVRLPERVALLAAWLRVLALDDAGSMDHVRRRLEACGAVGLMRWGMADREKRVLAGLPQLLQVIAEARDEVEALGAACAWLTSQRDVREASVVTDSGQVLAGTRSELASAEVHASGTSAPIGSARAIVAGTRAVAQAAIRYGGQTIAHLEVGGAGSAVETLTLWAAAVAPALASASRARMDAMATAATTHARLPEIVGRSPAMTHLRESLARAATTAFPVLIEGESGTGKELVARAIHRLSPRRDRAFCAINCAAISDDLLEAELFGHARGAFTGAVGPRAGLFEEADGGTLFLDEVADLSIRAQAKLLRVIQEREIRRLGESGTRRVNVRLVCATNRPLAEASAAGAFREDLVFRLAVIRVPVPPLRDRIEDLPALALSFWRPAAADAGTRAVLAPDALAVLARHRWPGNVRELQNVIAAVALAAPAQGRVTARHVSQAMRVLPTQPEFDGLALDEVRKRADRQAIAGALARHRGQRTAAARTLGVTRQGLAKAMRRVGLVPGPPTSEVA